MTWLLVSEEFQRENYGNLRSRSSVKTTVCLSIIAEVQKAGGIAAFVDVEHALDPVWAEILGVKLNDLLISQPDTGEQALEIVKPYSVRWRDLVVVDSIAALVPRAEIEEKWRCADGTSSKAYVSSAP